MLILAVFILFRINIALNQIKSEVQSPQLENLPAVFTGVMPCTDCPGIEYTLVLDENRFTEWSYYQERDDELYEVRGHWSLGNDTLKLYRDESEIHKTYLFSRDQIDMLDRDMQLITGENKEEYSFDRSPEEESIRQQHNELKSLGVEFVAGGNEPFWSIRINRDSLTTYRTPVDEISFPSYKMDELDNLRAMYRAEEDDKRIEISVSPGYCRDSMSGVLFTHRVSVQLNEQQTMRGCGRYL